MSYCRWSDDNWRSDIYAYEAVGGGYSIHVAAQRLAGDIPELPPLPAPDSPDNEMMAWVAAYQAQIEAAGICPRTPIGLPYDGKSFSEDTLDDFYARLRELQGMGYCVPDWVFDDIAAEMQEQKQEAR